jgi:formamidopyrimidine-DNA glycosylase
VPELPDVEGFRRLLEKHGTGHRVQRVEVPDPAVLHNTNPQGLGRSLRGRRLDEPSRHGKWLRAPFGTSTVLFHFGMTGALVWVTNEEFHPHDRVCIVLDDGELRYRDQRKLKGVWLAHDDREASDIMGSLGPDALGLSRQDLGDRLGGRRGRLKAVLMDQEVIAGLGNILSDEILWQARLDPSTSSRELTSPDLDRLHRVMQRVLRESVKLGFIPPEPGWLAGVRDADPPRCPRCGYPLRSQRIAGRTSWLCPPCQLGSGDR